MQKTPRTDSLGDQGSSFFLFVGDFQMAGKIGDHFCAALYNLGESKQIQVYWSGRNFDGEGNLRSKNVKESFGAMVPEE